MNGSYKNSVINLMLSYLNLESFCSTMLNLSKSLLSCRGALSTMATVRNHVSLLQLSKNEVKKGESDDI